MFHSRVFEIVLIAERVSFVLVNYISRMTKKQKPSTHRSNKKHPFPSAFSVRGHSIKGLHGRTRHGRGFWDTFTHGVNDFFTGKLPTETYLGLIPGVGGLAKAGYKIATGKPLKWSDAGSIAGDAMGGVGGLATNIGSAVAGHYGYGRKKYKYKK
jgi:hypothetical protein